MPFFDFSRRTAVPQTPSATEPGGWEVHQSPAGSEAAGTPSRWWGTSSGRSERESSPSGDEESFDSLSSSQSSLNTTNNSSIGVNHTWVANGLRQYTTPPFSRRTGRQQLSSSLTLRDASSTVLTASIVAEDDSDDPSSAASSPPLSPRERLAELASRIRSGSSSHKSSSNSSPRSCVGSSPTLSSRLDQDFESLLSMSKGLNSDLDRLESAIATGRQAKDRDREWFASVSEKLTLELASASRKLASLNSNNHNNSNKNNQSSASEAASSPSGSPTSSAAASRDVTQASSPVSLDGGGCWGVPHVKEHRVASIGARIDVNDDSVASHTI